MNTQTLIKTLKENFQDYEWYPTTDEILQTIKSNIEEYYGGVYYGNYPKFTMLDIGAGDGRVLDYMEASKKYVIEKSHIHINNLSEDKIIIGTDFYESTLIDKKVDIIFCNPPYSEFQTWVLKIIEESKSKIIYFVIPERWKENKEIQEALKTRNCKVRTLDSFDFLSGDRVARCKVEVVRIDLAYSSRCDGSDTDPFGIWFNKNFKLQTNETDLNEPKTKESTTFSDKVKNQLVLGKSVISVLVEMYQFEQAHLFKNYQSIQGLDSDILNELGVNINSLMDSFKMRIQNLKRKYWTEFFKNYTPLTSRLTHKTRKLMMEKLDELYSVDFNESNALAISAWAIKNANKYYDQQLIHLVEDMVDKCNVILYKSNQRTIRDEDWRYKYEMKEHLSHYGLELRIVLSKYRAIQNGGYDFEYPNGLSEQCHNYINDILVVCNNLGYSSLDNSFNREWKSNSSQDFHDTEGTKLFTLKAFKNGNLHIKFNQGLIKKLNIEFGRLKGWLKNWKEASDELGIPEAEAQKMFKSNYNLLSSSFLKQLTN